MATLWLPWIPDGYITISTVGDTPHTASVGEYLIACRYTATGAVTVNLYAASSVDAGTPLIIKDEGNNCAVNNITLVPNGADNINFAAANYIMNVSGMSLSLYSDGSSNWHIF